MEDLLVEISSCQLCAPALKLGARPVCKAHPASKIMIIGQAPGLAVHNSGIPWDDKSGENLRAWLGIPSDTFYNAELVAIVPMGFCYPGKGKTGDLAPRVECAPLWHPLLITQMKEVQLVLLIGKYAQDYYLKDLAKKNLTQTVKNYRDYLPKYFVLPHPSPRNNIWMSKNKWFKEEVLPELKFQIQTILAPKKQR